MSIITPQQFETLLPRAVAWAKEQEKIIVQSGVPLAPAQIADARKVGVISPEQVRLHRVVRIPVPSDPALAAAASAINLISPRTDGLTLRYGIFIRADCWGNRRLLVHELVHVAQYERIGGFDQFLRQYLHECITIGYPAAPMEEEAIKKSAVLCANDR